MGVFSTYDNVRGGNQKISERFLKKMGFKKSNQWGAPWNWGRDSEFWELIIAIDGRTTTASLIYFPPTFKAYVTPFNLNRLSPANKIIGEINNTSTETYDFTGEAFYKMDIVAAIDKLTENLKIYLKN